MVARFKKHIRNLVNSERQRILLFVSIFAIVGIAWLLYSSATSNSVSVELESGSAGNGANMILDPNASGGSLVQFGTTNKWRPSALVGGGYVNSIAYSPTDDPTNLNSLHVVVVTDVSGIFASDNGGASWRPANNVATGGSHLRAASVQWHPTTPGLVFVLLGDCVQGGGGVVRSVDYGRSFELVSTTPTGCGNQVPSGSGLPKPQPRHIGRLMAVDGQNGFLYVGTYNQGIMRASLNNLGSWQTVALAPGSGGVSNYYIRGLTIDDQDPTLVYAATYDGTTATDGDGRIWRIKSANSATPVVEKLAASPIDTEDVFVLAGNLYTASMAPSGGGIYRLGGARTAAASATFRLLSGPDYTSRACSSSTYPGNCTIWYSVNGYVEGGTTTLWVGASNPPTIGGTYKTFWKATSVTAFSSYDGSWTSYPAAKSNVKNDIIGPQGSWWKWNENTWAIPGYEGTYDIGDIAVGRSASHPIFVAGQVGIWRSTNGGIDWEPSLEGFLNLVNREVVADPNDPNKVYQTNVDYRMFQSNDKLQTVFSARPSGSVQDGWSIVLDASTNPTTIYLGLGDRDSNIDGQVWQRNSAGSWSQIDAGAF